MVNPPNTDHQDLFATIVAVGLCFSASLPGRLVVGIGYAPFRLRRIPGGEYGRAWLGSRIVANLRYGWFDLSLRSPARVFAIESRQPDLSRPETCRQSILVGVRAARTLGVHFDRLQPAGFSANLNVGMERSAVRAQV